MAVLYWLIVGHMFCDYPLQGDFLAKGKNHRQPLPGVPWYQCLGAHALIQGGAVALITHSIGLGLLETVCHAGIDYGKSEGWYDFNVDQALHIVCKIAWAFIISIGARP